MKSQINVFSVFDRAFIQRRRVFDGGVCFLITRIKSRTISINYFEILCKKNIYPAFLLRWSNYRLFIK